MFLLNLKLTIILLLKRPVVTSIKLLGLTIGVAVSILLLVYADQEFKYDSHFKHADRIYRTLTVWKEGSEVRINPICLRTIYEESGTSLPEVESIVQIYRGGSPDIKAGDQVFQSKRMLYADPEYAEVFTPTVLAGDVVKALSAPGLLMITDRLASTLFGSANAIGQTVIVSEKEYTIEAVVKELPYDTHFRFDFMAAMVDVEYLHQMGGMEFFTYTLFKDGVDLEAATAKASELYAAQVSQRFKDFGAEFGAEMEPLKSIHLFTKAAYDLSPNGDVTIIISLTLLSVLILILALSNYISLFLVHNENRSLEIGIRKASGSGQNKLIGLFMAEAFGLTLIAFLCGLMLLHATSNWIRTVFQLGLDPEIWSDPLFYLKVFILLVVTALFAGIYPALYLSRLHPVKAILGSKSGGTRRRRLMRIAVIFQFSITVFLITSIGILYRQMNYVNTLPLGFNPKEVIIIGNLNSTLVNNQDAIKAALINIPEVESAGASQGTPASGKSGQLIHLYGQSPETGISIAEERVQTGYFSTLGIEFANGRAFRDGSSYDKNCVILNETAAKRLGFDDLVGQQVMLFNDPSEVIGVVKDFHFASLKHEIGPLVFTYKNPVIYNFMVRCRPGTEESVQNKIREVINNFDPDQAVHLSFLEESLRNRYAKEQQLSRILLAGAILAIVLSIMGLFALSLFGILDRTKEIGVRKVMGASVSQVSTSIIWSMTKWTILSIPIGAAPAYYVMGKWMSNFVYKTNLAWWLFLLAGLIALSIAVITVIFQVIRVANRNPVESLRYE